MAGTLISPRLRFAYQPGAFSLSYRGSEEPQHLDIDLLATGKVFPFPPTIALNGWIAHANMGFAAGVEFSPTRTRVEQVSGRRPGDAGDSTGPAYRFGLSVACVSPYFLRTLVDRLSTPSAKVDVAHLQITGALAVDASPLSVTTERMKKWLKDRSAYVGRPSGLPFDLSEKAVKGDRRVRVTFVSAPSAEQLTAFALLISNWSNAIARYPNVTGDAPGSAAFGVQDTTQEGCVVTTMLTKFLYAPAPAVDSLLGALVRFHAERLPMALVDIHA